MVDKKETVGMKKLRKEYSEEHQKQHEELKDKLALYFKDGCPDIIDNKYSLTQSQLMYAVHNFTDFAMEYRKCKKSS